MPHYKNGITAKVGDIVKGIGYNSKHEIIGRVIALTVGNSCNVQVACITSSSKEWKRNTRLVLRRLLSTVSVRPSRRLDNGSITWRRSIRWHLHKAIYPCRLEVPIVRSLLCAVHCDMFILSWE